VTDQSAETSSRFLIGIDLGTTNSAMSFVDTAEKTWAVRDFPIPQLVAAGQVEARDVLPSFHYEAAEDEFSAGALRLRWEPADSTRAFVGVFARDHGGEVAGRLISSAKSWLSHSGVDRTAALLPWHGAPDVQKLSPVEVSSRYLAHLRTAWDSAHPEHPLAQQEIALAVPASFDEVARELTIQAAQRAGLVRVFLVEEPQAAFYAWIDSQGADWDKRVRTGQTILVCDVGGGTSDFTLIRVKPSKDGGVLFHRVAVGEHLILGGDNLDLALAHYVEAKLGAAKLQPRQWGLLIRLCRQVKETFLGRNPPEKLSVSVAAPGAKLIGGARQVELTRAEVEGLLVDGFLPIVESAARPTARRSGFQEFGLPYASDAAITRYLAAFLTAHREATDAQASRPDLVLFNGGLFESPFLRERLIDVLKKWFSQNDPSWSPVILQNNRMDLAVARGAAYYGTVRRGRGVRISGGLAHAYYLGVETDKEPAAICLLPAGVEQGQVIELTGRRLLLRVRQPAEFPLYYSSTRTTDRAGDLIPIDPEQLTTLPPIRTVLQSSRATEDRQTASVQLHARLTEVGTLDIWCAEVAGDRRWKLQFDVRSATRSDAARHAGQGETGGVMDEQVLAECRVIVREGFSVDNEQTPVGIVKKLEAITTISRQDWPPTLLRDFWETLVQVESARSRSVEHEARWLSLTGFCLRPGYGLAVDDWRVAQTWRMFAAGIKHPKNELCRAEWWILWRRIAGGLLPAQQALIGEPLAADWRAFFRKGGVGVRGRSPQFQFGPHESGEVWRLLGSLEMLRIPTKGELGKMILDRLPRERSAASRDAMLFGLGRLGARQQVYGPLNLVLPADEASEWASRLMQMAVTDPRMVFAIVQLSRRTGDRHRDLSETRRAEIADWLSSRSADEHLIRLVKEGGALQETEQRNVFGESLPAGLRIE
jgi:molecular chaperone DnaK (HSP70)